MPRGDLPFTIALTGGIASGKTLVSNEFNKLGVMIIDTDVIAHQIVEPGQPALLEIANTFGPGILDENGRLRRKHLRDLIFTDPDARRRLESILHPKIRQEVADAISEVTDDYCILVIPLLAERGAYPDIDRVLLVDVDPETQISRLMARDHTSREEAERALASQASREHRLAIADDVIDNSGTQEEVRREVTLLNREYIKLANSTSHDTV